MQNILAIDCGTQSLRAILFDQIGNMLASQRVEFSPPYHSPFAGWAEQDVQVYWQAMVSAIGKIKKDYPQEFGKLVGMGVTSQRDTLVLIDKHGKVLRPAILWLDTRAAQGSYKPNMVMHAIYKLIGAFDKIVKVQADGKTNWLKENEPEIWQKTDKALFLSTYFHYRLTGSVKESVASMVGHLPFNNRKRNWAGDSALESLLLPLEQAKRCQLVESGEVIGTIHQAAAKETGLPLGLPLVACGSDKACETIGMGAIDANMASLSFGTTATVEVCTHKYFEPVFLMPAYCSVLPDSWLAEIEIFRGYWMITWFLDELGEKDKEEAIRNGRVPEKVLDKMLESSSPGGKGLILQPYWGSSLKDIFAKGSIIGFGDVHGKPAIYRAIIEGLAYSLREGLEIMEKKGKFHCSKVVASGGASKSDHICQITSDILNRPLLRGKTTETSALGAAIVVAKGLSLYSTWQDAVNNMVQYEKTFFPNPQHREIYDGLYHVYKKIYASLKNIYKEIQKVTGYPE